jgi:N-acyl-phosphatidylethanolamine-hydrolysing phospholipase D
MFRLMAFLPLVAALYSCLSHQPFDEKRWREDVLSRDPRSLYASHKKGDRYYNPWMEMEDHGFSQLLKWKLLSKGQAYSAEEKTFLPAVVPDLKTRIEASGKSDFIAWIGHATFLIRVNGQYWVTDPVFSKRVLLPKRKVATPITMDDLKQVAPQISVLISHDHYDHLDKATIRGLAPVARAFVPAGVGSYMKKFGVKDTTETDWWQTIDCGNGVKLVCLPAQHWSKRIGEPVNSSLWASYLLITPSTTIYIGGDSGYFVGYKEIGKRYPRIDYAILPACAYHPRWFMHYAHMSADESVDAFLDLGAKNYIPLGWGTFALGDEPAGYPAMDLSRIAESRKLDSSRVKILGVGDILPLATRHAGNP